MEDFMAKGILGLKLGITSIFVGDTAVPVTLIKAGPCMVIDKKTKDKDGYNALKVGFVEIDPKKLNKPLLGVFSKKNLPSFKFIREIRNVEGEIGEAITVEQFNNEKFVKITGTSKGKGYAGVVKRWGFAGWPKTHGHNSTRRPGSIGQRSTPGRVFKGMHMAGHLGDDTITISNIQVVKVTPEKNLILVKGSIPGPENGLVLIRT
ncbi:MAG: 50S ribosomal protein L3 [Caldisericum sp. CG2_30_36_11]|jgi:large subunit ribosomal protein L3|nr:MAG: 50S ribosomal protein L3 [Caldisericum sp. CG2_30_36_11]